MKKNIKLYPLKFHPLLFEKIWGGTKLNLLLDKKGESLNIGESWELSTVPGNISVVKDGELQNHDLVSLISEYKGRLVGEKIYREYGIEFPLLIKFIDARDNLSIQVHPDDNMAKKYHNGSGKTEMWYVLDAGNNSTLISGFDKSISPEQYSSLVENGRLTDVLKVNQAKTGDAFFIPAGRIHAIGKGIMVAEIQQMSDITYRVYDFDRIDSSGQKRELHIDKAAEALHFEDLDSGKVDYKLIDNHKTNLVECSFFNCGIIRITDYVNRNYSTPDSFRILICVEGSAEISNGDSYNLKLGETMLIPAEIKHITIKSENATILEVYADK